MKIEMTDYPDEIFHSQMMPHLPMKGMSFSVEHGSHGPGMWSQYSY